MRRYAGMVLSVALAGCGEESRPTGPTPRAGRGPGPEGLPEVPRRTAKADVDDAIARLGGNVVEDAAKAKALADRTLTSSDVLTFLTVQPLVRSLGDDPVVVANIDSVWIDRGDALSDLIRLWDPDRMDAAGCPSGDA